MKLLIKSFGQHVDLEDSTEVSHFLLVQNEEGKSLHLPVPQETIMELTKFIYTEKTNHDEMPKRPLPHSMTQPIHGDDLPENTTPEDVKELIQYATTFGGEDEQDPEVSDELLPEDTLQTQEDPASEDDVESV